MEINLFALDVMSVFVLVTRTDYRYQGALPVMTNDERILWFIESSVNWKVVCLFVFNLEKKSEVCDQF